MKDFHRRLAVVALRVLEPYGFVLAGGYAISAHGMGARPSMDVDLFTASTDPQRFNEAVARLRSALAGAGLVVTDNRMRPLFADLAVADPISGESSDLQLGMNYREYPPHVVEIGPVLDVRDAVAGKMSALWSRGEARDFIASKRRLRLALVVGRGLLCVGPGRFKHVEQLRGNPVDTAPHAPDREFLKPSAGHGVPDHVARALSGEACCLLEPGHRHAAPSSPDQAGRPNRR